VLALDSEHLVHEEIGARLGITRQAAQQRWGTT